MGEAAVRRALAHRRLTPRAFIRIVRPHAWGVTNWDSNAVLCRTWQIPSTNTSARHMYGNTWLPRARGQRTSKAKRSNRPRSGLPFLPRSAFEVDHGTRMGATADRRVFAAAKPCRRACDASTCGMVLRHSCHPPASGSPGSIAIGRSRSTGSFGSSIGREFRRHVLLRPFRANLAFGTLPRALDAKLKAAGASY